MFKDKLEEVLNFFNPIRLIDFSDTSFKSDKTSMGNNMMVNYDINPLSPAEKFEVALVCVNYELQSEGNVNTPQLIREQFYRLKRPSNALRIADLGNLIVGKDLNETNFAVQEVCALLFHMGVNVLLIGGSQYLTIGNFQALKEFETDINLVHIDSKINLNVEDEIPGKFDYLNQLIEKNESHLYNLACIGHQSYLVDQKQINRLNEKYFEIFRLGKVRDKIEEVEPPIRDAHLVSFDISAIRLCDAPGQEDGSPNGLYAEEACRLARYAGISDRVKSFGLYEIKAELDQEKRTTKLAAQILWYYLEGYINRKHDFPDISTMNYTKYEVQIDEIDFPIVFYRSCISNRWWIEVKKINNQTNSETATLVSCAESDYLKACENEISDRWWINFKKLS
jgi:arginase family enzyme